MLSLSPRCLGLNQDVPLWLFQKVLVLCFTFKSVAHFEIIFVQGVRFKLSYMCFFLPGDIHLL